MKRVFLAITLALFALMNAGAAPLSEAVIYAQKKGEDKRKEPSGPPVVRNKGQDSRPKDPPKKGKRPE